jgi:hypothetical protein
LCLVPSSNTGFAAPWSHRHMTWMTHRRLSPSGGCIRILDFA